MNKLEVIYFRDDKGRIRSLINIDNYSEYYDGKLLASSHNLIDLIEEKDIVTVCDCFGGHKLDTYMVDNNNKNNSLDTLKGIIDKAGYEIREILTHEQYEANVYRLDEKE